MMCISYLLFFILHLSLVSSPVLVVAGINKVTAEVLPARYYAARCLRSWIWALVCGSYSSFLETDFHKMSIWGGTVASGCLGLSGKSWTRGCLISSLFLPGKSKFQAYKPNDTEWPNVQRWSPSRSLGEAGDSSRVPLSYGQCVLQGPTAVHRCPVQLCWWKTWLHVCSHPPAFTSVGM